MAELNDWHELSALQAREAAPSSMSDRIVGYGGIAYALLLIKLPGRCRKVNPGITRQEIKTEAALGKE